MTSKKWSEPKGKQNAGTGSNGKTEPEIGDTVLCKNGHTYRIIRIITAPYKRNEQGKHVVTGYVLVKGNSTIEASPDEIRF